MSNCMWSAYFVFSYNYDISVQPLLSQPCGDRVLCKESKFPAQVWRFKSIILVSVPGDSLVVSWLPYNMETQHWRWMSLDGWKPEGLACSSHLSPALKKQLIVVEANHGPARTALFPSFLLNYYSNMSEVTWVCSCRGVHVEIRKELCGVGSPLPPLYGFQGLNSGREDFAANTLPGLLYSNPFQGMFLII